MAFLLSAVPLFAQQIDLDALGDVFKKKPLKITGGLSASAMFYGGNENYARDPWNYFLSGNINFSIYEQFNLPFSFNLTNSGANMAYPSLPNRFSIHPTYKWMAGHFGDVSMSFSPYTLSGHQFTGGGVDLSPGKWRISAMTGRLQRKVEYNPQEPSLLPCFQRMGYGGKVRYEGERFKIGLIGFYAKDDENSLSQSTDSLRVFPQRNLVLEIDATLQVLSDLSLTVEYAHSILTQDLRAATTAGNAWFDRLVDKRLSTQNYNALRLQLNYVFWQNAIGLTYERVDPDYATLGAYYFNNDFENITINYARPFFRDKLTFALNLGLQRDDLNHYSESSSNRFVGSANVSYVPTEQVNMNLSYSNFQTHTNVKSQFDYINEFNPTDNLDTLNFSQLSQNAALAVNYTFGNNNKAAPKHNLSFTFSYQETVDKQGEVVYTGGLTRFYTLALMYGLRLPPQNLQISTSLNASYNDMGLDNFLTLGPLLSITGRFFKKKLSAGLSSSYNASFDKGVVQNNILNLRGNMGYLLAGKHNLMANALYQYRTYKNRNNTSGITATIGYSYSF
jgi:hypothetical protein